MGYQFWPSIIRVKFREKRYRGHISEYTINENNRLNQLTCKKEHGEKARNIVKIESEKNVFKI